jgi:FAD-dependent urate hydroxylase
MSIDTIRNKQRAQIATRIRVSGLPECDVTVIGAGPYGLSVSAYLKTKGLGVRVFGEPMEFWANQMPQGMLLRSPREASNIADPLSAFTLEDYESASNTKPKAPVPLETFVEYGKWFYHHLGSDLDTAKVAEVCRENSTFHVTLEDGISFRTRRVVVAAGIGPFQSKPVAFAQLPAARCSHCYEGRKLADFARKRVAVVGAGQSALESAALLHESGAEVEVIARIEALRWIGMHSWLHHLGPLSKVLYSKHDVGPAGISRLVANPNLVRRFPLKFKDKIRTRAVRPAGARWLPERLTAVKITTGCRVQQAELAGEEVELKLDDGSKRRVDHVLLGTGYRVDISRYAFLSPSLVSSVQQLDGYPQVTTGFCSSVPGLHFIGATAARSFGPLLYFVTGTEFASKHLAHYIAQNRTTVAL